MLDVATAFCLLIRKTLEENNSHALVAVLEFIIQILDLAVEFIDTACCALKIDRAVRVMS